MMTSALRWLRARDLAALRWLRARDGELAALRRAGRVALVMPAVLAVGVGLGRPSLATFGAFGSVSMLLFVDFRGAMRDRIQAQLALAGAGLVLICLGTVVAPVTGLAVATTLVLAFVILFSGVVSSVLAGAATALLLPLILTVTLPAPVSALPARLAGWSLAAGVSVLAIWLLWPAPVREPLRGRAIAAATAVAGRLRAEVARTLDQPGGTPAEVAEAIGRANEAVATLHRDFYATPYRPTGLSTAARTLVRLVDELGWLTSVVAQSARMSPDQPINRSACALKLAAAEVLERGSDLLQRPAGDPAPLRDALAAMRERRDAVEREATHLLPAGPAPSGFLDSLDPGFRAHEVSFAVGVIAANIDQAAEADRRTWVERVLGRQPAGVDSPLSAAWQRAAAHLEVHSVWLHNSVRAAVALALAVLIADVTGVQHSFWVVLGTLSVLRSSVLNTGQNAVRGLLGTFVGILIGGVLVAALGPNPYLSWILLPPALLFAGLAPAAISFAAGQAGFTVALLLLFNVIERAGPAVGLVRIEDVAIGSAVSLVVGALFWPRGAGQALRRALAEAYADSASYLRAAVTFGAARCASGRPLEPAPHDEATRAAAAARRLDDAFRTYLSERGAKPVPLMDITSLVTGVAGLRLAADGVLDLWDRAGGAAPGDRRTASRQLAQAGDSVSGWYTTLAGALTGRSAVPDPMGRQRDIDAVLIDSVRRELRDDDGRGTAVAVRMIWTGDHLDAARRLQSTLVGPARTAVPR